MKADRRGDLIVALDAPGHQRPCCACELNYPLRGLFKMKKVPTAGSGSGPRSMGSSTWPPTLTQSPEPVPPTVRQMSASFNKTVMKGIRS
jgi:hypothetical protein